MGAGRSRTAGCDAPVGRARRRGPLAGLAQCVSRSPLAAGIIGAGRSWTACTISVLSMPRKYTDVTPRSAWPELPLDDDQRHTLARHLDSVSMPELMRGQLPTHTGRDRGVAQLNTDPSG